MSIHAPRGSEWTGASLAAQMAAPRSVLYSVAASLAAAHLMSQVPGFRRRFEVTESA